MNDATLAQGVLMTRETIQREWVRLSAEDCSALAIEQSMQLQLLLIQRTNELFDALNRPRPFGGYLIESIIASAESMVNGGGFSGLAWEVH